MVRVGIVGATGYTAVELIKILLRHPEVEITCLTSRDTESPRISEVHSSLRQRIDLQLSLFEPDQFAEQVDFAFSCLPHAASAGAVKELSSRKIRVVDFSADYRLNDLESFEKLYQVTHPDSDRVGKVPYGIPELFGDQIPTADVVANPGCFPTSAIIPLAPLVKLGYVDPGQIIVDSKTGISGAGRKANLKFHFPECNESISAYGVGTHRHGPEINQILKRCSNVETNIYFVPHLVPMDRGILSTIYFRSNKPLADLNRALNEAYQDAPFVRLADRPPQTKDVTGTNFCDIHVCQHGDMFVMVSALDNLVKGASGAAVQNFNVMNGFDQTTSLL